MPPGDGAGLARLTTKVPEPPTGMLRVVGDSEMPDPVTVTPAEALAPARPAGRPVSGSVAVIVPEPAATPVTLKVVVVEPAGVTTAPPERRPHRRATGEQQVDIDRGSLRRGDGQGVGTTAADRDGQRARCDGQSVDHLDLDLGDAPAEVGWEL